MGITPRYGPLGIHGGGQASIDACLHGVGSCDKARTYTEDVEEFSAAGFKDVGLLEERVTS